MIIYVDHMIWSIWHGPYYMIHVVWSILYGVVIKMANFFLNILDWFKARLSKWRTFLELSKWRIIFYQNDELFRSYQNGELLRYQNRELFLSKWRISFIKMANSKWRNWGLLNHNQNGIYSVIPGIIPGNTGIIIYHFGIIFN